jgi:predicted O-methyltransferase YrrM
VRGYFDAHDKGKQIYSLLGNALEVIPTLSQTWDLVFIDADKLNYSAYFDMVLPTVRKGGFIIVDNVLWSGKVLDEKMNDKDTEAIRNFNKKIAENQDIFKLLLPLRDGLMFVQVR